MENESHMSLLIFPNSGNTYYFRRKIPTDLIEHFGGLKEFRISLKCTIKSLKSSMRETEWIDKTSWSSWKIEGDDTDLKWTQIIN